MNTTYQTLIVKFSEPITALDGIFDDTGAWGTDTLKGWIDDYESTRFTATDSHTAVITSEYNMECVKGRRSMLSKTRTNLRCPFSLIKSEMSCIHVLNS